MTTASSARGQKPAAVSQTTVALDQIREDIIRGRLGPGTKLKIELLQQRYNVGATPVREALSLLSATGLVERIEQRGFRVATVSDEDYAEILWTRCFLEERALRESILHGGQDWEERIVLAQHHMLRASETLSGDNPDSIQHWERWHAVFHAALISACRSRSLLRFCAQLYDEGNRYRYIARMAPGARGGSYDEHRRIADAVLRREADTAVTLLLDHFRRTGDLLRGNLADFDPAAGHKPRLRVL